MIIQKVSRGKPCQNTPQYNLNNKAKTSFVSFDTKDAFQRQNKTVPSFGTGSAVLERPAKFVSDIPRKAVLEALRPIAEAAQGISDDLTPLSSALTHFKEKTNEAILKERITRETNQERTPFYKGFRDEFNNKTVGIAGYLALALQKEKKDLPSIASQCKALGDVVTFCTDKWCALEGFANKAEGIPAKKVLELFDKMPQDTIAYPEFSISNQESLTGVTISDPLAFWNSFWFPMAELQDKIQSKMGSKAKEEIKVIIERGQGGDTEPYYASLIVSNLDLPDGFARTSELLTEHGKVIDFVDKTSDKIHIRVPLLGIGFNKN